MTELVSGEMLGTSELPVFIGNFRSGTTLLVNLLGLHTSIAPWFETKAFCEALRWLKVLNHPECVEFEESLINPRQLRGFHADAVAERMRSDFRTTAARIRGDEPSGKMEHELYPIGYDSALYSLEEAEVMLERWQAAVSGEPDTAALARATGRLITDLGQRHAQLAGKPLWINKTPEIPRFGREIHQCLPSSRIILLIRDGRQVIQSASQLGWAEAKEIATWWKGLIEETREAATDHPDHYLEMRYEDLVRDPVAEVDRLLFFLGLEPCGQLLVADYLRRLRRDNFDEGREQALSATVDWKAFDAIAGDLMRQLGYY